MVVGLSVELQFVAGRDAVLCVFGIRSGVMRSERNASFFEAVSLITNNRSGNEVNVSRT